MSGIPRRRASELIALYSVEASIRDIVVEGPADAAIVKHVAARHLPLGSRVWHAEQIDFDFDPVASGGHRERLVQFAEAAQPLDSDSIIVVVDADLDTVLGRLPVLANLLPTEYTNLSMHIFSPQVFLEYVSRVYYKQLAPRALDGCLRVAKTMFAIRCTGVQTGLACDVVDPRKDLSIIADDVDFDLETYLVRLDSKNGTGGKWARLIELVSSMEDGWPRAIGYYVNDHDLELIVHWALVEVCGVSDRGLSEANWLSRALRANIGLVDIAQDTFFASLLRRL